MSGLNAVDNDLDLVPATSPAAQPPVSSGTTSTTTTAAPTTSTTANGTTLESAKNTIASSAQSAMDTIANHPITQNVKETTLNGPVGQAVQAESAKTSAEFSDLANARQIPDEQAATGQPLTQYHSLFYRLLSWRSPRATGITFAATVLFIFAARYLNVIRYIFKGLYIVMGVTAAAELAGHAVLGNGLATQMRPRKYWTFPKESLERALDDVEQLINFFVIEFQRILFVENIWVTVGAFVSSFISYYLVKFVPLWGLTLIGDCVIFLAPLIYVSNKEFIDQNLRNAGNAINEQTTQVKNLAAQHTGQATETIRQYAGEYTQKAQELMGTAQHRTRQKIGNVQDSDFPTAPKTEPTTTGTTGATQAKATGFESYESKGFEPIPAPKTDSAPLAAL